MTLVADLLNRKGRDVWSIGPDATVFEALELMAEKNIGALLVVDGGGVVGAFSERDYARKVVLKGKQSKETKVRELMSSPVYFVSPDKTTDDCMALMTDQRVRHLPVLDGGKLVGIVSIGDVVNNIMAEQKDQIKNLEDYITGRGYGA